MYSIGIDIGGTNTDMGVVNEEGKIIARRNMATSKYTNFELYVSDLVGEIRAMLNDDGIELSAIDGIGIGAPNGNYYTCCVENAMNLRMKGILNFAQEFSKHIDVPIVLSNDANAAAYGEYIYGGAKGMKNFIMFTLGTGVGSGIVIDGRLLLGSTGAAGELGHTIIVPNGRQCSCGLRGCTEAYASARGILQTYAEIRAEYDALHRPDQEVRNEKWINHSTALADITCRDLSLASREGDPLAIRTFELTGHYLGIAMANAVAFSSPKAIFMMGGPTKVGDPLMIPLRREFENHLLSNFKGTCKIRLSELPANDVAILGAAALLKMK